MFLRSLDIVNFKNIISASLKLSEGVNCLLGLNGMGKSNLLEAVWLLCTARGLTPGPETNLITHGCDMMLVKGTIDEDSGAEAELSCGIVRGKGKTLKCNGKEYQKYSSHFGKFPIVIASPADSRLVSDSADIRRKLMDMVISQADGAYLSLLIRYRKAIESRNRMLRSGIRDKLLFEAVEAPLCEAAALIADRRNRWVEEISSPFARYYSAIAADGETASLSYRSSLNERTMQEILDANRDKDAALGYTLAGPHRDDISMRLGSYSMRTLGSQGQVKTLTIALRLAIFDFLRESSRKTPLLLLDDIFDKLDASRVDKIMQLVSGSEFGQIFITDTNRKHLDEILASISGPKSLMSVDNGEFKPIIDPHGI